VTVRSVRSDSGEAEDSDGEHADSDTVWFRYTQCDMLCVLYCIVLFCIVLTVLN
jgi:hypothetical protein